MTFKDEGKKYGKHTSIAWKISMATMVLLAVGLVAVFYWLLRPYDDLTMEVIDGGKLVDVTEYTEDGLPVIRSDDKVTFYVDTCNQGVDTTTERWMDSSNTYGQSQVLVEKAGESISSYGIPPVLFSNEASFCGEIKLAMKVPDFMPDGRVYSLRYETTYQANPLRSIPVTVESEEFYLAPNDKP